MKRSTGHRLTPFFKLDANLRSRFLWGIAGLVLLLPAAAAAQQRASEVLVQPPLAERVPWGMFDPYHAVTSRVHAQAELIRAQADAQVGYGAARQLNAEAYDQELDNWLKHVRVYWQRKIEREKLRLELEDVQQIRKIKFLNDRKWQNNRIWNRLQNHPELNAASIESGKALNFLLSRLAASALPYRFDEATTQFSPEALRQMSLERRWLEDITLKQDQYVFSASHEADGEISHWPYLLRWQEFSAGREAYEQARQAAFQEARESGQVSVARIREMQQRLAELSKSFHQSTAVKQWVEENRRFIAFHTSDKFLRYQDHEIRQLERTGDIRPFRGQQRFEPDRDGAHAVAFLAYLNRNGIEFAPARPGNEYAYHNLFVIMRALYLTVAENDPSIQPEKLGELAE